MRAHVTFVVGVIAATLVVSGCRKASESSDTQAERSSRTVRSSEVTDSTAAGDRGQTARSQPTPAVTEPRDVCTLLTAQEVTEIAGLPIERVEKKPNGCEWYANATAQRQKGAETARTTFEKMSRQEPNSADEGRRTMENLLKGLSTDQDHPANATAQCGVAWLNWGTTGDGLDRPTAGSLLMRHLLPSPAFTQPFKNVVTPGTEAQVLGPYLPKGTYMSHQQFETRGCPVRG